MKIVLGWILVILYVIGLFIFALLIIGGLWILIGQLTGLPIVMQCFATILCFVILAVTVLKAHLITLFKALKHDISNYREPTQTPAQKFCANCGMKLTDDAEFCPFCGTPASKERIQDVISAEGLKKQYQRERAYETSFGIIYLIGGFILALGLAGGIVLILGLPPGPLFNDVFIWQKNNGLYLIIVGLIFLVLGFFVQRKSNIALILAIAIYGLDGFVCFLSSISQSLQGNSIEYMFTVVIAISHIVFIVPMIKGVSAIKALKLGLISE